jgi:predicted RNase H-like HicB family nuclease
MSEITLSIRSPPPLSVSVRQIHWHPGVVPRIVYSELGGGTHLITFKVELEHEEDGRWLAEVVELPGVLAYGETQELALSRVQALALRVIAERLEQGEAGPELLSISFNAA